MRAKGGEYPGERPCAHPGCPLPGTYRAPVHKPGSSLAPPSGPPQWQYFCLDHVRAFNAQWNYFEGMDAETIFQQQTPYPTWDRETRHFAHTAHAHTDAVNRMEEAISTLRWRAAATPRASALTPEDRRSLSRLGLEETATLADAKKKYRLLARRYHPDTNGGDRQHEPRLQALTEAIDQLAASPTFAATRAP